jgi:hypothetical protein
VTEKRLTKFNAARQHWGTYLQGFSWDIYGCGTYREPVSEVRAEMLLRRYMENLSKKLRCKVHYFAALERRYSGCGMSPVPVHWHFLAASTTSNMSNVAEALWNRMFGISQVESYDESKNGAFYIVKCVSDQNGTFLISDDLAAYHGPSDLIASAHENDYVPNHLKDRVFGEYLVVR